MRNVIKRKIKYKKQRQLKRLPIEHWLFNVPDLNKVLCLVSLTLSYPIKVFGLVVVPAEPAELVLPDDMLLLDIDITE